MLLKSTYRETYCEFCKGTVYAAKTALPSWLNEWVGHTLWRYHRHSIDHQVNRALCGVQAP